jgi:hypothetical protein
MKFCILLLLFASCVSPHLLRAESVVSFEPRDDMARLDGLITGTEENLRREKALQGILKEYKKAEAEAIKNPNDSDKLSKLVLLAKKAYGAIVEASLEDYFSPQFLEELKKLSQIAERKNVPAPK